MREVSGMKTRECLPCQEREDYVLEVRRAGVTRVTERQRNRYIDEFLRFCLEQSHQASVRKISVVDLKAYGKHVARSSRKFTTARTKVAIVLVWCRWLFDKGHIKQNLADGLNSSDLLPQTRKGELRRSWD
jgi:site-specific recombinase XerD